MNKKGVLGLETVKAVILSLLVLAVLTVTVFAILVPLKTSVESIDNQIGVVSVNETPTPFTEVTPYYFSVVNTARNPICTLTRCTNATGLSATVGITANNYTVNSGQCSIVYAGLVQGYYNNTAGWRCTYTYTYDLNGTNSVTEMMLVGPSSFFQNTPTFFVLLGVVVLILIISIVIVAVTRFSGGVGMGGGGGSTGSLENV